MLEPSNILAPFSFSIKKEFASLNYCNFTKIRDGDNLKVVPVTITWGMK